MITNGTPMWLQHSTWSRALHSVLEQRLGTNPANTCGTDDASQRRYRNTMAEAGLDVTETRFDYTDELDLDRLVGGVYPRCLTSGCRRRASGQPSLTRSAAPSPRTHGSLNPSPVRMLLGRRPQP